MRTEAPAIHRYVLQPQKGEAGWAVILLTGDGQFCAFADSGNYAFWWPAHGKTDFRAFFLDAEEDYLTDKLTSGRPRHFDGHATARLIRETIAQRRRTGSLTKEAARAEMEAVRVIDGASGEADFRDWLHTTKLPDAYELAVYGFEPAALSFVRHLLLGRLVPLLRSELEAAGIVAPAEARA